MIQYDNMYLQAIYAALNNTIFNSSPFLPEQLRCVYEASTLLRNDYALV